MDLGSNFIHGGAFYFVHVSLCDKCRKLFTKFPLLAWNKPLKTHLFSSKMTFFIKNPFMA